MHLVVIPLASLRRGIEAGAALHRLYRVVRHHRLGEFGIELVVDRLAEAGGHARSHHFDDCADRGTGLAHAVEVVFPVFRRRGVRAPEGVLLHGTPIPIGALVAMRPHLDAGAADDDRLRQPGVTALDAVAAGRTATHGSRETTVA